jgi:hypothetical protein
LFYFSSQQLDNPKFAFFIAVYSVVTFQEGVPDCGTIYVLFAQMEADELLTNVLLAALAPAA